MNSLLLFTAAISNIAFSGLLKDVLEDSATAIGDTCGDCYRLQLLGESRDRDEETNTFTYKLSVKDDGSCANLRYLCLGLDNYCSRPVAELEGLIAFDFGDFAPGNSGPDPIFTAATTAANREVLEIELDLKHKLSAGDYQIFSLVVSKEDTTAYPPVNYQSPLGDRTKRSNTDDNLLGFESTNGQAEKTCYVDVTKRSFPELCRPPKTPTSPTGIRTDRNGPGEFIGCESIAIDDNCDNGAVCVAELEGIRGHPCDGGKGSVFSNRDGTMRNAVCVEVRSSGCETDDDCESEDRCFTKLGTIDNPLYDAESNTFPSDRQYEATCAQTVCGSTNFN